MLRPLILAGLTFAAAFLLVRELATRNGVGVFEYVLGIAVVAGLLLVSYRLARRAFRRPASP